MNKRNCVEKNIVEISRDGIFHIALINITLLIMLRMYNIDKKVISFGQLEDKICQTLLL